MSYLDGSRRSSNISPLVSVILKSRMVSRADCPACAIMVRASSILRAVTLQMQVVFICSFTSVGIKLSAAEAGRCADSLIRKRDRAVCRLATNRASFTGVTNTASGDRPRASAGNSSFDRRASIQRLPIASNSSRCMSRKSAIIIRNSAHEPERVKNATASAKSNDCIGWVSMSSMAWSTTEDQSAR